MDFNFDIDESFALDQEYVTIAGQEDLDRENEVWYAGWADSMQMGPLDLDLTNYG